MEVDYVNEVYKLNLPEGENYETLGGLIVDEAEEIPEEGDIVTIGIFKFKVLEVSSTKIDIVELYIIDED